MNGYVNRLAAIVLVTLLLGVGRIPANAWESAVDSWVARAGAILAEPPANNPAAQSAPAAPGPNATSQPPQLPDLATPRPVAAAAEPLANDMLPPGAPTDWDLYAGGMYANTGPLWVHAEYMLMWTSGTRLPPLLTTSPAGTPIGQAGMVGQPTTTHLFGNQLMGDSARSGLRTTVGVRLGHWFDYFMDAQLEAHLLYLGNPAPNGDFHGISSGDPILTRPFYDVANGTEAVQLLAFPNIAGGVIHYDTASELLSTGILYRRPWRCGTWGSVDWMAGYRYVKFEDQLYALGESTTYGAGGPLPVDTYFRTTDRFKTWSEFNGGELGLQFWTQYRGWTIDILGKMAIGAMANTVDVQGTTLMIDANGLTTQSAGGVYAQPTNLGRHRSTYFSTVPELGIRLRRRISHSFVFSLGYTLMLVDHVARVGEQIDRSINTTQMGGNPLVGAARPSAPMNDRLLWVQGLTFGLEW